MLFRSIALSILFILPTTAVADDALADLDPDFDSDLEDIQNAPTAKESSTNERRQPSFNALDEEEFEMDLSSVTPIAPIADPDAELEPVEMTAGSFNDTDEPMETMDVTTTDELYLDDEIDEVPTPVAPDDGHIDWNLDLDEDIEIGDKEITSKEKVKSAPVDLDFLDEE